MIKRVWSSLPNFALVEFTPGFNIVLADRTSDAEETESTNGLGKTTLLRVIHFCLGSDISKDKVVGHPNLKNATFGIDLTMGATLVQVERNTSNDRVVIVSNSAFEGVAIEHDYLDAGRSKLTLENWKLLLTLRYYGSAVAYSKSGPKFRDIARYLMRVGKDAYMDPQVSFRQQSGASRRLCTGFLLGLNWEKQAELQGDITARDHVKVGAQVLASADAGSKTPSIGELEADRVAIETAIRHKRDEVEHFNVREDYAQLEDELNEVDRRLHDLINENYSDKRLLDFYRRSAKELPEVDPSRPVEILKEAGAFFKEEGLRRLSEVAAFHSTVYKNRREFVAGEMQRLKQSIASRGEKITTLSNQKTRVLGILNSSGALETLIDLQRGYTELVAKREALAALLDERRKFQRREDELTESIAHLRRVMRADLEDRQASVDEARVLFAQFTEALYGRPGRLSVDVARDGYSFSFSIDRQGSDGVDQMVVFCFDLTVATLWAKHQQGLLVLMHDSAMFADVDPRQYKAALMLASQQSTLHGFQYVCCLNSGSLPVDRMGELNLQASIRVRLNDRGPRGRLLGLNLPPVEKQRRTKKPKQ